MGAYHLSELTGLEELVLIGVNGNRKDQFSRGRAWELRDASRRQR